MAPIGNYRIPLTPYFYQLHHVNISGNGNDRSRVGGGENPFLDGSDLSTMVGTDRASGSGLDLQGYARYQNRSGISGSDRSLLNAIREIGTMASRINLPKTITVCISSFVEVSGWSWSYVGQSLSLKNYCNFCLYTFFL